MRFLRIVRRVCSVLTVLVLLAVSAVGGVVFLCLPGSHETARIPGLSAPVSIAFDAHGIPHITAATAEDGAAALGFVHARDRMFQMELMRRAASGRVSELAGPAGVPLDRSMRVLGLRHQTELGMAALPAPTLKLLEAYAHGVNAYLGAHGRWTAVQFAVLGKPEPWTPVDSLLWGKTMGIYLSGNWRSELSRLSLAATLPRSLIDQLWPPQDDTPSPSAALVQPGFAALAGAVDAFMPRFPDPFTLPDEASNEWAVDGAHSKTGAPLLAGDPHLGFSTPGIWYLARIDTPQGTLAGAFAPGVPLLVIGRTDKIAWTFTTNGADTQDVFTETVLPDGRYATPDGPAAFTTRVEHIGVRGAPPVDMVVRETRHGPVVSDIPGLAAPEGTVFAAEMANLARGDDAATGLLALNHAATVAEAGLAAPLITAPVQNLLVADHAGIGQFTTGRVPIRRAGNGEWPQPGADGAHDWIGWATGDQLPHMVNPASGRIVNGNERVSPPDFQVFMGRDFYGDWRARRVRDLLGHAKLSIDDFTAIQMDVTSSFAQHLLPILAARPRHGDMLGRAAALLDGWDGRMEMDLPQPLIFNAWVQRFAALVLEHGHVPLNAPTPWEDFVAWVLTPAGAAWCDGDCGPMLDQALREAMAPLVTRFGADPTQWEWGDLHVATFADPVLSFLTSRIAQPGDDTTIFRGGYPLGSVEALHGPSYRGIYDLADLDRSRFNAAPGQSGNPFSLHFRDMLIPWRDGGFVTLGPTVADRGDTLSLRP